MMPFSPEHLKWDENWNLPPPPPAEGDDESPPGPQAEPNEIVLVRNKEGIKIYPKLF